VAQLPDLPADPLAEIAAPLGLSAGMAVRGRATLPRPHEPDEAEHYDAELLAHLVSEPASLNEGARQLRQPLRAGLPRSWRAVLYVLVLFAALAPLLVPFSNEWITPRDEVLRLTTTVADLSAGAPVLLVWAYDASYGGEIDPLAGALLQDLGGRAAQVDVVAMSPACLGQARLVAAETAADVALLGYLPTGAAGWRLLAEDGQRSLLGAQADRPFEALSHYALVVLLANDANSVRGWVEQAGAASGVAPMTIVPARSEASLQPYRQSGQLGAVLGAGWAASEYEVAASLPGEGVSRATGLAALSMVIVTMTAAAMLVGPGRQDAPESHR